MIKLVTSDLDGTLITQRDTEISDEMARLIHELRERGIYFAPASGRQLKSLRGIFHKVADECMYISENGAVVWNLEGEVIRKTPMDRQVAHEVIWDFYDRSDDQGEILISGVNKSYLMIRSEESAMLKRIQFIKNNYQVVKRPEDVPEDIVKVATYFPDGSAKFIDRFRDKWAFINCAISGPLWIDVMVANKGTGVHDLCNYLGIDPSEVMSFGDNFNDIPMLDLVGTPVLVNTAVQELKDRYPIHTTRPEDALREWLASGRLS